MARIGIDTGGTFTDFVMVDAGRVTTWKQPSTPDDPSRAILEGLARAGPAARGSEVVHGSTVATNALLEGKTARAVFVTNRGFEDMLEIGRQARPDLYNLDVERPRPLAPRELRFGIAGRIGPEGEIIEPLEPGELKALAETIAQAGAGAVAICLLHSYANTSHEEQAGAALAPRGLAVSLSSRLACEYREYERASTTLVNAAVAPVMARYLKRLEEGLAVHAPAALRIMGSNGGALSARAAGQEAVRTVLSGPAAGARAAAYVSRQIGLPDLISFDMGGTSTDVCLIAGEPGATSLGTVAGHPVRTPMIDIHTVGAGGGSIAWRDAGGALRVGPASAGADPGPACYGRGGPATVTDAHLHLGHLDPDRPLGGSVRLDGAAALGALEPLAASLGLSLDRAAQGILDVAAATMARAVRVISLHRGHEPADFALLAFGGAGGLHAAALAESLGISRCVVPAASGMFSAFGMVISDVMRESARTVMRDASALTPADLLALSAPLQESCARDLAADGVDSTRIVWRLGLDLRYRGQSHELTVPGSGDWVGAFHADHLRRFGFHCPDEPVELVTIRLTGIARVEPIEIPAAAGATRTGARRPAARRTIVWRGDRLEAEMLEREDLGIIDPDGTTGNTNGPLLILDPGATTLVPPGWSAARDGHGHLHLRRQA